MKSITVEELEKIPAEMRTIVDVRKPDEYARGTMPGAVNIPMEEFWDRKDGIDRDKPVYVLCHTGQMSTSVTELLEDDGYDSFNVEGGWRSWLRLLLKREVEKEEREALTARAAAIEKSIITTYRRGIWRQFTKAVHDFELIKEGDRIAVCISGGKDSMLLAKLMQELQRHGKVHFDLVFLCMNPGYNEENWSIVQNNAKIMGIPLTTFDSEIFDIVADIPKSPCYLCARMRRGYLYSRAKELGCNKIALGHHFDDVVETVLMGMLFAGKFETMMPKLHSKNFEGMELIRPLYFVHEHDIKAWRDHNNLHFIQCACRFTENCATCGGAKGSRRDDMKELVAELRKKDPNVDRNIFHATTNVSLKTMIGYHTDEWEYNFLDDYDEKDAVKPGFSVREDAVDEIRKASVCRTDGPNAG
ncbi:tRNA(Ile)-lysidine synthase TilS/MesJ [[Clostridium] aminophilum]|uniref:tRNA(Ile)-lysidine synthase TilS/MesJ n=1 Tax=[Clostridium] aminophilum TaxID=1526 RepID=A0A1H9ZZ08_9FIRM|nr:ATP-binding protein [[Clostridium] aminophilum]SES87043.1 tRNA(Ile)-lysidine synthase TilS/MesJ [[Clostridium] aminophilum]